MRRRTIARIEEDVLKSHNHTRVIANERASSERCGGCIDLLSLQEHRELARKCLVTLNNKD